MAEPARRLSEKPMPYWLAEPGPVKLSVRTAELDAEITRLETFLGLKQLPRQE